MNFLAHILLSGENEEIRFGNFIGDFVKGNQILQYSEGIQKGISLHRFIDEFTDNHQVVLESKKRLRPKYRHYAPVIVDIYYDHFLANDWQHHHSTPLLQFTTNFYKEVQRFSESTPERARKMLFYMSRDNWLYHYRTMEGIKRVLVGMNNRSKFESGMNLATNDLIEHFTEFESEFRLFFPDLKKASKQYLKLTL